MLFKLTPLFLASLLPQVVSGVTTCQGSNTPLSAAYLSSMNRNGNQVNNFVPSAYFLGKATKFVTTEEGLTEIDDPNICVDGKEETEIIQLFDDGTHGDDVAGDGKFKLVYEAAVVYESH